MVGAIGLLMSLYPDDHRVRRLTLLLAASAVTLVSIFWNLAEILLSFDVPGCRKGNLPEFFSFHSLSVLPDTRLLIDSYTVLFTVSVSGRGSNAKLISKAAICKSTTSAPNGQSSLASSAAKTRCSLTRPMLLRERVLYGLVDIA